ncbi:MAG TPA: DVUA0089 family protein [Chthoniobacterales bacterium]|jgi:hypothetical protein
MAAACLLWVTAPANAQSYTEVIDAGQTLATAASTGIAGVPLTSIVGTISTSIDADLFAITITSTTSFSAVASSNAGIDTSLFLFNSAGVPIMANDDSSNSSLQAALPAGNSLLMTLTAGTYYIGISLSGNEPINLNSQLLFTLDQPTTKVRGMAANLNPQTESNFDGATYYPETGDYTITLSATQGAINPNLIPEPSSFVMLVLGAGVAVCLSRLRTKRQAPVVAASGASI